MLDRFLKFNIIHEKRAKIIEKIINHRQMDSHFLLSAANYLAITEDKISNSIDGIEMQLIVSDNIIQSENLNSNILTKIIEALDNIPNKLNEEIKRLQQKGEKLNQRDEKLRKEIKRISKLAKEKERELRP